MLWVVKRFYNVGQQDQSVDSDSNTEEIEAEATRLEVTKYLLAAFLKQAKVYEIDMDMGTSSS